MGGPAADEAERGGGSEPRPAPRGAAFGLGSALAPTRVLAGLGFAGLLLVACAGQPKVLVDAAGTGNASETIDSASSQGWDVHWTYDCSTTGGHGIFVIDVFDADRTPDFKFPGVSEEGDNDTGVYHVPRSGRFYLEITTTCRWTVKVVDRT